MRRFGKLVGVLFTFFSFFFAWFVITELQRTSLYERNSYVPLVNTTILSRKRQASSSQPTQKPYCSAFLVIVVITDPKNFDRRNAIRYTWGSERNVKITSQTIDQEHETTELVKTVFLLGQSADIETQNLVEKEATHFSDIIFGTFTDSYKNLTRKTKFGLQWAAHRCQLKYFLKTDDDVFVNIRGLIPWMMKLPRKNLYTGRCDFNKTVIRIKNHKWGVSKKDYPHDRFPSYCTGMGYILSSDVLLKMITIIDREPLFPLEDVYVGLMIQKLQIKTVDNRRYIQVNSVYSGDICKRKNMFLTHSVSPIQTIRLHLKFLYISQCI